MFDKPSTEYIAVAQNGDDIVRNAIHGTCSHCGCRRVPRRSRVELVSLSTSAILALALVFVLFSRLSPVYSPTSQTDFAPLRNAIDYGQVRFTGAAAFHENGSAYRVMQPGAPQYVGTPSAEIDDAWKALITGRFFYITEQEAKEAWGEEYKNYHLDEYGIRVELDVLHNLHCVNMIRQALHPEYYPVPPDDDFRKYHIDILRQQVQCAGDLTLIPTKWYEGIHRRFIDSDQTHTCRNFQQIRDWATDRFNGSSAVRNMSDVLDTH